MRANMYLIFSLFYRHYIVWTRRILVFLAMYIIGPTIMLYGFNAAFGLGDRMSFILPGIIANSVAAGAFINCSFGAMERLVNKRYDAWLATSISIPQMVVAEALFQCVRGMVIATGIWVASLLMGASGNPLPLIISFVPMVLVGWTCAMLGYCTAATARSFSDIELVEPLLTAAFVFSGVFVSLSTFAWPLQWFGKTLPIYHGIEVMRPLFMGTTTLLPALMHMGILIVMAGGSTLAAIHLFKKRLVD